MTLSSALYISVFPLMTIRRRRGKLSVIQVESHRLEDISTILRVSRVDNTTTPEETERKDTNFHPEIIDSFAVKNGKRGKFLF